MKKIFRLIILALGFFTTIPVPFLKWNEEDNKFLPLFIPFVGIIISGLFYGVLFILQLSDISILLQAIIIVSFFVFITGGLHMDAFMDTCDAHFSRRDMERKLEIMKDSNIGAFAALFLVVLLLLKVGFIYELLLHDVDLLFLVPIPFISRFMQSVLLLNTRFAKEDGLARMYGSLPKKNQLYFILYIIIFVLYLYVTSYTYGVLVIFAALYYIYYKRFAIKQFGGITGDVIGAYIEIVEVVMYAGIIIYGVAYLW